jgi:hypothetical protein
MKKWIFLGLFSVCGMIFAEGYDFKESPIDYQKKEPSDSKFLRINSLEIKVGELESRIKDLEEKVKALTAAR